MEGRSETDLSRRLGSYHLSDGCEVFPVATDGCEDGRKVKGQIVRQTQTRLVDACLCACSFPPQVGCGVAPFHCWSCFHSQHCCGEETQPLCLSALCLFSLHWIAAGVQVTAAAH